MKDLSKLTDEEVVEYLSGKKITVTNSISGSSEEIIIRSDSKNKPAISAGIMKFLSPSGWRFIKTSNITSVGRKKVG